MVENLYHFSNMLVDSELVVHVSFNPRADLTFDFQKKNNSIVVHSEA